MNQDVQNALILGGMFTALFALAEALYHWCGVKAEYTRKMVHVVSGISSLAFPILFDTHWMVLALCSSFALVLWLSYQYNHLPSINKVGRHTHGGLLFPVVVYLCFWGYTQSEMYIYYFLPILILALSDPLAALAGKSMPIGPYLVFGQSKTLMGSSAFFVSALLCTTLALWLMEGAALPKAFIAGAFIALVTTTVEAISHKGYDNLLIPISGIAALLFVQQIQLF